MKCFGIIKTGYTSGIYGNSGEYFTCVFVNSKGMKSFCFNGQYGVEERVSRMMQDRGYKDFYISGDYGQLKRKDIASKRTYSEWVVEKNIDELIKHGYIESL